jgi:CubicO group peptidase (beta-lactamase class C family)
LLLELMVERGEMGLDDPISKFLPAYVKVPHSGTREITLRDPVTRAAQLIANEDAGTPAAPLEPPSLPASDDLEAWKGIGCFLEKRIQMPTGRNFDFESSHL